MYRVTPDGVATKTTYLRLGDLPRDIDEQGF